MYVPFEQMPDTARVWLYLSEKELSDEIVSQLKPMLTQFCNQWKAHGKSLSASFTILLHRYICLAVDETASAASGCSIDASVKQLAIINNQYGLDLFNNGRVLFWANNQWQTVSFEKIKQYIATGQLTPQTKVINSMVNTVGEIGNNFLTTAQQTWISRYFKTAV